MRRHRFTLGFTIFFLFFSILLNAQENLNWDEVSNNRPEVYFRFQVENKAELKIIGRQLSVDNVVGAWVYAYANRNEFQRFSKLNKKYEILLAPGLQIENPRMMGVEGLRDVNEWDTYPTYEAYVSMMYAFEQDYPAICKVSVLGTLASGRKILAVRITDNLLMHENEPEFFYTSSMHGDELTGYVTMLRLIDHFLSNYGTDQRITSMINNMEIWINPLANPDGTYFGGNESVSGATRGNANGIDFNRNFPDPEDGPHPDDNEWQPETIIFMDFAEMHSFVMSCNMHGGAEVCNYPWDTWFKRHTDTDWWELVCRQYADTIHVYGPENYMSDLDNGVTNGYDWYSISGGRQDYMNYFHQCREFTLEMSGVKLVPAHMLPDYWEYNYRSLINYIAQANNGIKGIVTDSITGQALIAEVFVVGHDMDSSMVFTTLPIGNYYRPIFAGTYDLRASSEGYHTKVVENVLAINGTMTIKNIELVSLYADMNELETTIGNVFPNPVSGNFISIESVEVIDKLNLFDANGKCVFELEPGICKYQIDVSGIDAGIYFLQLQSEKKTETHKIVRLR
jgi:zinc carboxypeptidase/type IX secretion system substrate protein